MTTLILLALALQEIEPLIRDLHGDDPEAREKAVDKLAGIGRPALEALRKVEAGSDITARALAQKAIHLIDWGKAEKELHEYVGRRFDDAAKLEEVKIKAVEPWMVDVRFYKIDEEPEAAGGAMAIAGLRGGGRTSLFAVRRERGGFTRIALKGIFAPDSLVALIKDRSFKISGTGDALDFATALVELQNAVSGGGGVNYVVGYGGSSLVKTQAGWKLEMGNLGGSFTIVTDADGILTDLRHEASNIYGALAGANRNEEKERLEVEKLKLELELLRRQLEQIKKDK